MAASPIPLRPGFGRALLGLVACGLALAFTYRTIGTGGAFFIGAVTLIVMGMLLRGAHGMFLGMLFTFPLYAILQFKAAPATAPFIDIFITLNIYLGALPTLYLVLGFILRRWTGVLVGAVIFAPLLLTYMIAPAVMPSFFTVPWKDAATNGATLLFAGFGSVFGMVWGIGGLARGAQAHEGPAYIAKLDAPPRPNYVRQARQTVEKLLPSIRALIIPMIRPALIAVGITTVLVFALMFVATNPIVPVSRVQTNNPAAATTAVTVDKLLQFLLIGGVVIGSVVVLAALLMLGINALSRQINTAKAAKPEPLPAETFRASSIVGFFISWLYDILETLRRSVIRKV